MAKAKKAKKTTTKPAHHKVIDDYTFIIIAGGAVVIILLGLMTFSNFPFGSRMKQSSAVVMKEVVNENTVQIDEGGSLMPETLTVKKGSEIVFMNNDKLSHRVVTADGNFDSKELMAGEKASYVFDVVGEYEYSVDEGVMRGTIVVE